MLSVPHDEDEEDENVFLLHTTIKSMISETTLNR